MTPDLRSLFPIFMSSSAPHCIGRLNGPIPHSSPHCDEVFSSEDQNFPIIALSSRSLCTGRPVQLHSNFCKAEVFTSEDLASDEITELSGVPLAPEDFADRAQPYKALYNDTIFTSRDQRFSHASES